MANMKKEGVKPMENMTNMPNKGAWTAEEDRKLAEVIAIHGARKWKTIAAKAGKCTHILRCSYIIFTKERNNLLDLNYALCIAI